MLTLPSGRVADGLKEFTGLDQDTLCNKVLVKSGRALGIIMSRRVDTIDDVPMTEEGFNSLLSGDRLALMLELRKLSLGDEFEFSHTCSNSDCAKESEYKVDLNSDDLAMKPYPNGDTRKFNFLLPKSNMQVSFTLLDGVAEQWIAKQSPNITTNTALMARKPQYIVNDKEAPLNLANVNLSDITALRKYVKSLEGGVDPTVEVQCPHCETSNKVNMIQNVSFFFPAAT
jgi:hypothetical protein